MSHLNFRWSITDMDDIANRARHHEDAAMIAEAHLTTEGEILALCARNGITVRATRLQGAKNAEDDSPKGPQVW
jgi:hypothetical protein